LQCGIDLARGPEGTVEVTGRVDFPVNRGGLCVKGATSAELLDHPERLTTPLVRDAPGAPLRPASWDTALDRIASAIGRAQRSYGPDSVGCFGGGGLTNEKAYQLGKFARVALGSSAIDYNGRFCMSSAAAAGTRAFGLDRGLPFPLADIPLADVVLLVGANPADTMPPAMRFFQEGRERGARHIVVDPRRTATAELAHRHLQPVPNTDLSLANGMLHVAIRDGLVDEAYLARRTVGFEAVRRIVRADWPDRVERTTGNDWLQPGRFPNREHITQAPSASDSDLTRGAHALTGSHSAAPATPSPRITVSFEARIDIGEARRMSAIRLDEGSDLSPAASVVESADVVAARLPALLSQSG